MDDLQSITALKRQLQQQLLNSFDPPEAEALVRRLIEDLSGKSWSAWLTGETSRISEELADDIRR